MAIGIMPKTGPVKRRPLIVILAGIILVAAVSLYAGFAAAFSDFIQHIIKDFTVELPEHIYIAGVVLVLAGIWMYLKRGRK